MPKSRSVLIVEDDSTARKLVASLLRQAGFDVVEAGSVAEGIAMADDQCVAILDQKLHDGLGTEVLQHIQLHFLRTRTAFYTGLGPAMADAFVEGAGPDALFHKPQDVIALLAWVNEQRLLDDAAMADLHARARSTKVGFSTHCCGHFIHRWQRIRSVSGESSVFQWLTADDHPASQPFPTLPDAQTWCQANPKLDPPADAEAPSTTETPRHGEERG